MQHNTYGSSKSTYRSNRSNPVKLRKHRVQMSPEEMTAAESLVHSIQHPNWNNPHLTKEMQEDGISVADVQETLRRGVVIEVNSLSRVVMRLMDGAAAGTCVVINVSNGNLVTAWKDNRNDHHSTLRMSQYTWNVNVVAYLKEIR